MRFVAAKPLRLEPADSGDLWGPDPQARIGRQCSGYLEGIQGPDPEGRGILDVPRYHDEMVNEGGGGDQRISQQVVRLPVHQLGPGTKGAPVERQDIPRLLDLVDPGLDLGGLVRVLFAGDLDAGLELAQGDAERWRSPSAIPPEPREDGAVGPGPCGGRAMRFVEDVQPLRAGGTWKRGAKAAGKPESAACPCAPGTDKEGNWSNCGEWSSISANGCWYE